MALKLLPTEILQAILIFLDSDTFYFASLTCKAWRRAALSIYTLHQQLRNVPESVIPTSVFTDSTTPEEIRTLFLRVCRTNIIGMRRGIELDSRQVSRKADGDGHAPIQSRPRHGIPHSAQLHGLTLTLNPSPTKSATREVHLSPSIFPNPHSVGSVMGHDKIRTLFMSRAFARFHFTLSRCRELVAVALGQKIHVYLLSPGGGKQLHVEGEVSDNSLDSVQRLEFVGGDELIRCEVNGVEGLYVLYLGYGRCKCDVHEVRSGFKAENQKLEYWENALRHVYLDSTRIEERLGGGLSISLRGMQLVNPSSTQVQACPSHGGKFFVGLLRQQSCKNMYALGAISSNGAVDIIQQIPSRPRTKSLLDNPETEKSITKSVLEQDRWNTENIPLAQCHNPVLSVSDDGRIMVIYEPPHGRLRGAIYVCSGYTTYSEKDVPEPAVAWPFLLSEIGHELETLYVSSEKATGNYVVARSQRHMMQWRLGRAY
ncbi:hypothetical protein BDW59DRAFT_160343 [Aspergillus cavernicola]|uniref:F-box domain-containing protein n=1 Tax=Aspergillus cavernicola TaxID=176166 RepID=A0ABR4IHY9_9EURO